MFGAAAAAFRRATVRLNQRFAAPVASKGATAAQGKVIAPVGRRTLADGAKDIEEQYAQSLSVMHWLIAGGFVTCGVAVRCKFAVVCVCVRVPCACVPEESRTCPFIPPTLSLAPSVGPSVLPDDDDVPF